MIQTIYLDKNTKEIVLDQGGTYEIIVTHHFVNALVLLIKENVEVVLQEKYLSNVSIVWDKKIEKNAKVRNEIYMLSKETTGDYASSIELLQTSQYESRVISYADDVTVNQTVLLKEKGAKCHLEMRVLAGHKAKCEGKVTVLHQSPFTKSNIVNYGVSLDDSFITFDVVSEIDKGKRKSEAYQTSRVLLLGDKSKTNVNPVLRVDEADVKASHAASAHRISPLDLYYMQSRGLRIKEAELLVVKGFLTKDMTDKEKLEEEIERRFLYVS